MTGNTTFMHHRNNTTNIDSERLPTTPNMSHCLEATTPVYDHQGAMRFTVAVVLVYGIGVIGILGIYVRRKPSEVQEKETHVFVKGLNEYRKRVEKRSQLSSVQNLINSIHGNGCKYSGTPASSIPSTPLTTPEINQVNLSSKQYGIDGRIVGSPGCVESVPLMSSCRKPGLIRGLSSYTIERQDSIPETEEEEEEDGFSFGTIGTPGSETSSVGNIRPTFCLRLPPAKRRRADPQSAEAVVNLRGDNSCNDGSASSEQPGTDNVDKDISVSLSANEKDLKNTLPEPTTNGRFTVVNVQEV